MANEFVRNVKGVRNINKLSRNITTENDLISTNDNEVYVVTNAGYKKITGGETEQDIQLLETDVKNLKTQSDSNTSEIETFKTSLEENTSKIETLKKSTDNNTSNIETLETSTDDNTSKIRGLQTSTGNNTSEIDNLKTRINNYKVLLFDGSSGNTGDVITLNQSYEDFTELRIKISRTGGNEILSFDAEDDRGLSINITNIYNDNTGARLYEMVINKISSTELEISSQRSNTVAETSPTDDSAITILKIWGVK